MFDVAAGTGIALAVGAGIATFFSPCAYPLLPGYVAFAVSRPDGSGPSLSQSLARGLVAGSGIVLALSVLSGVAFWAGTQVIGHLTVLEPLVGILLIGLGVSVLVDWSPPVAISLPARRRSLAGFGLFGFGYGIAAVGCVAPVFVTVIATAFTSPGINGLAIVGTYVAVVAGLMVSLTVATGIGVLAGGTRFSSYTGTIKRAAGVVIVLAGIGQLYVALALSASL